MILRILMRIYAFSLAYSLGYFMVWWVYVNVAAQVATVAMQQHARECRLLAVSPLHGSLLQSVRYGALVADS